MMSVSLSCTSQDSDKSDDNDEQGNREKAAAWIKENYKDVSDLEYETDDNGYLEVHFESDGEDYRADFHQNGEWIETEQSVDWDDLPDAIQEAIEEDFDKDDIAELEYVDNKEKGKFYDVEFKKSGKNRDIMFREDGTRI